MERYFDIMNSNVHSNKYSSVLHHLLLLSSFISNCKKSSSYWTVRVKIEASNVNDKVNYK